MAINLYHTDKRNTSSVIPKTLMIGRRQIEELLSINEALKAVENAVKLSAKGETIMPSKIYLNLPQL